MFKIRAVSSESKPDSALSCLLYTSINVAISGVAKADSVLTAGYTYEQAEDGEAEGESIIAWESSDTADDAGFAPIEGAVGRTFTIPASLAGKFVRIRVTPVDKNGFAGKSVVSAPVQVTNTISVYVATDGSDSNPGTIDQPFASLEAARDYLRANKPAGAAATVYVRGGVYQLSKTFSLGQQDSGTEDAPVIYRAYGDEKVTLSGGLMIDYNKFSPISDAAMKAKLKSTEAQGKVVVADLDEIGLGDFAKIPIKDNNSTIAVPLFVFDGKAPVSYTHLDVYKRQVMRSRSNNAAAGRRKPLKPHWVSATQRPRPVSYTHLDVYKRQARDW